MYSVQSHFSVLRGSYINFSLRTVGQMPHRYFQTMDVPRLQGVRYNAFYQTLSVTFEDGCVEHYLLVPVNTYLDLIDAESPDDYFRSCIQGLYIRGIKR
jgi:hypothetical protein